MSETLSQKQRRFTRLQGEFITWAFANGYELTDGDAYRDPRVHGALGEKKGYGHKNSGHKNRLARDYNLFIDNRYEVTTDAYRPLGEKWLTMADDAAWGGDFSDGNHFSLEHNGVK
jgi:hypothetical protein